MREITNEGCIESFAVVEATILGDWSVKEKSNNRKEIELAAKVLGAEPGRWVRVMKITTTRELLD